MKAIFVIENVPVISNGKSVGHGTLFVDENYDKVYDTNLTGTDLGSVFSELTRKHPEAKIYTQEWVSLDGEVFGNEKKAPAPLKPVEPKPVSQTTSVNSRLKDVIVEQIGVSPDSIKPDSSFMDDLGCDSLDAVEIIMAVEEEFDIEISDEQAEAFKTVGQMQDHLVSSGCVM